MADTATIDTPAPEAAAPAPATAPAPAPASTDGQGQQGFRPRREGARGGPRDFRQRRKVCVFCVEKISEIDYKDTARLRRFISDRGKIEPRRKSGTCAKHQRRLSVALKRARFMALLPYTGEHIRSLEPSGGSHGERRDVGRPERSTIAEVPQAEAPPAQAPQAESAPSTGGEGAPPEPTAAAPEEQPTPAGQPSERSTETQAASE